MWQYIVILVALLVAAVGVWLILRDTTPKPPPPPGRHRRPARDPHDPIRDDHEEPPEQQ